MKKPDGGKPPQSWDVLCQLEAKRWRLLDDIERARRRFIETTPNRGAVIRAALDRGERWTPLHTIEVLPEHERRQFLPDLVHFASIEIRDMPLARHIILSMNRDWLLANVEPLIWSELGPSAAGEQFSLLAQLAEKIDAGLLSRIVDRALASDNPEIRGLGLDSRRSK